MKLFWITFLTSVTVIASLVAAPPEKHVEYHEGEVIYQCLLEDEQNLYIVRIPKFGRVALTVASSKMFEAEVGSLIEILLTHTVPSSGHHNYHIKAIANAEASDNWHDCIAIGYSCWRQPRELLSLKEYHPTWAFLHVEVFSDDPHPWSVPEYFETMGLSKKELRKTSQVGDLIFLIKPSRGNLFVGEEGYHVIGKGYHICNTSNGKTSKAFKGIFWD